jgi:carbon monoxide dehydrogenase subunit G
LTEISKNLEVEAPIEKVWAIVADLQKEHRFWSEFRAVEILSKAGGGVERKVYVRRGPMGEEKSLQTLVADPDQWATTLTMTKGPVLGTRRMTLTRVGKNRTRIDVDWDVEMKGVPGFALGFAKAGISEATGKALSEIAEDAERSEC